MLDWRETGALAGARAVFHELAAATGLAGVDFLLVYQDGRRWASWGMAREAGRLTVWSCAAGADLGAFASLAAALSTVTGMQAAKWRNHGSSIIHRPTSRC